MNQFEPDGTTESYEEVFKKKGPGRPRLEEQVDAVIFDTGAGGLGKNIQSTAVVEAIFHKYRDKLKKPDVHIITPHLSVYKNYPGIFRVWHPGAANGLYSLTQTMYNNPAWLNAEPYRDRNYIKGDKHIIRAWREQLDLPGQKDVQPHLYLNKVELQAGRDIVRSIKGPVVVFQITGGVVKIRQTKEGQEVFSYPKMYNRNIKPILFQEVVDELKADYGFIQLATKGQPLIQGAKHLIDYDLRTVFGVIAEAQIIVSIDSFVQHAAAALNKRAIVLWGATRPQSLGYSIHNNLYRIACPTPLCNRPNSFVFDTEPDGKPWVCPFGTPCLNHDVGNIINHIRTF